MTIYCCQCEDMVEARLTNGREIYPHRRDLFILPFWICDTCKNYVGCHHKTNEPHKPLGVIPNKAMREARGQIHKILDPLWKNGSMRRKQVYKLISDTLGYAYHTAELRSLEEARKVYFIVKDIAS